MSDEGKTPIANVSAMWNTKEKAVMIDISIADSATVQSYLVKFPDLLRESLEDALRKEKEDKNSRR
ncbi:MAG: hypothetical protein IPL01_16585 [Acidobacteria bacterium]|nr:hypothetical protein [Acidobacteriota bacterium]